MNRAFVHGLLWGLSLGLAVATLVSRIDARRFEAISQTLEGR